MGSDLREGVPTSYPGFLGRRIDDDVELLTPSRRRCNTLAARAKGHHESRRVRVEAVGLRSRAGEPAHLIDAHVLRGFHLLAYLLEG